MLPLPDVYERIREAAAGAVALATLTPSLLDKAPWPDLVQERDCIRRVLREIDIRRRSITHQRIKMAWDIVHAPIEAMLRAEAERITAELERRSLPAAAK